VQNVHEFEDKEFANVSKDDLKLAGKDEAEKKAEKKLRVRSSCPAARATVARLPAGCKAAPLPAGCLARALLSPSCR
jgi:hypothetical protein